MLENVVIILSEKCPLELQKQGEDELLRHHVRVVILPLEDVCDWESTGKIMADLKNQFHLTKEKLMSNSLCITDISLVCSFLCNQNIPVIALLQDYNKNENFSGTKYAMETVEYMEYVYLEKVFFRFQKMPWKIAETNRCMIREMCENDMEDIWKLYENDGMKESIGGFAKEETSAEHLLDEGVQEGSQQEKYLSYIKEYIKQVYEFYEFGIWMIEEKETGQIIGRAGIEIGDEEGECGLGYMIDPKFQGQGYAYEVCTEVIGLARDECGFEKISALIKDGNVPSIKLAKKLGFIHENERILDNEKYQKYIKLLNQSKKCKKRY